MSKITHEITATYWPPEEKDSESATVTWACHRHGYSGILAWRKGDYTTSMTEAGAEECGKALSDIARKNPESPVV